MAPSETDCYYGCNGWSEQSCGGPWRVTVYKIDPANLYEVDILNQKEMLISQNGLWMAYLNSAGIFSIYVKFIILFEYKWRFNKLIL